MEPVAAIFRSHEADRADLEYYRRLTPAERLEILLTLIERARKEGDASTGTRRELIASLSSQGVEYLIVGGYAMAYHGIPRFTDDIDFLVGSSPENAARIEKALGPLREGLYGAWPCDSTWPAAEPDRSAHIDQRRTVRGSMA